MDAGTWIWSLERNLSEGCCKLCNTLRSLIATLQASISRGQTDGEENVAIKSSNTLAETIKNVDSGGKTNAGGGNPIVFFYFTVSLASTATSPEMVD